MTRTPSTSAIIPFTIGTAAIVADDVLTILAADDAFRALLAGSDAAAAGLADQLPSETAGRLRAALLAGAPHTEASVFLPRDGRPVRVRLSALRVPDENRDALPVYHLVLTDLSRLAQSPRAADLKKQTCAFIPDRAANIPFQYDFASDTMTYADQYRVLFGLEPVIPRFRARLSRGEALGGANDHFRTQFAAMDMPPGEFPECHVRTVDGGCRRFALFCTRLCDGAGNPLKAVGAVRDIDLHKRELDRQTDLTLYQAKANGKNRYEMFGHKSRNEIRNAAGPATDLATRVTRTSLLADIIDILFSVDDMDQGIDKALDFMGNALGVSAILIYEKSFDLKILDLTREWTARPEWSVQKQRRNLSAERFRLPLPDPGETIYSCSDLTTLPPDRREFDIDPAVTSLLQCDMVRDGVALGVISLEKRGTRRIWTRQEIDALALIAKLIGGHLSQTRSASLLRRHNETIRDIVNSLPGAFVYVVSKSTYRLLYFNRRIAERFPHARPGMTCHEAFQNRAAPCADCATRVAGNSGSACPLLRGSPFGDNARLFASDIGWENGESAYVALISEQTLTAEEREREQRSEAYIRVLCGTYDYVLDIDAAADHYELLALNENFRIPIPAAGAYTAIHNAFTDDHIVPDDRDVFRTRFSLPEMKAAFLAGTPAVEAEYRWLKPGFPSCWKHRIALPHRHADGSFHVLTYVRDITLQKEKELRSREEEADYLLALQSNYTEIFRIDLNTWHLSPLYYNSDQVAISTGATDLWDFVLQRVHNRVHPDCLPSVLEYYAPAHIRACVDRGEIAETEYRKRFGEDSPYRWIAATLRPVPGQPDAALVLLRDVSRVREEEANFYAALTNSYTEIYEMDLDEDTVRVISSSSGVDLGELTLSYRQDTLAIARTKIHPEDREAFLAFYDPDTLRHTLADGHQTTLDYRMRSVDGGWRALSGTVLAVPGAKNGKILVLTRDVTDQKTLEKDRHLQIQRFAIALRDTHSEIYEVDLDANQSTLLVKNSARLMPVGVDDLKDTDAIAAKAIYPDDRAKTVDAFTGAKLRQRFENGETEVSLEYRRLTVDGDYCWVQGVAVPLREENGTARKAVLLVKDIAERKREEQRRRLAEQYDRALRNIYDELYELNVTRDAYRIVYHMDDKYVTPPEEGRVSDAVSDVAEHMIHPDDKERFLAFFDLDAVRASFAAGREFLLGEFRKLWTDGAWHWASLTMFPLAPPGRAPRYEPGCDEPDEVYLVFIMDIDARKQAEEVARQNAVLENQRMADERYRIIVEQTNTLVFEWCKSNSTRFVSPELIRRFAGDYDDRDILRVWREDGVIHPDDLPLLEEFRHTAAVGEHAEMTVRFRRRTGGHIWCKAAISCLRDKRGVPYRYIGTLNDVDDATRSIQALRYRAEYDPLTGVHNMHTFYTRAEQLIRSHPEREYSIIRMDIDRFKVVNDLYGLEEGDRLLKTMADALRELMPERGVCGRLSGDIFCVCVDYTREEVMAFVNAMTEKLAAYPLASRLVPSFGICRVDSPDTPISVLCDWANLALKTVKGNVLVSYAFYDETLRNRILVEKNIENRMNEALEQGQFQLYLQPKVHIPTSRIIGSEGLVRWVPSDGTIIPPDKFIPLFEKNGFIIRLDEYIWEQACMTLRRWLDQGLVPTPMSVNVSRLHVHDTRLCEKLAALIDRYRLPPHLLELELTESMFLDNNDVLLETINTLQRRGFLLSLDDFGTGYSSLNLLKGLPIDIIKIDRGFLGEVGTSLRGRTVVRHTIALVRDLDLQIIAEGVETGEQAAFLLDAGCDLAQGFHYSRPVPVAQFERLAFGPMPPFPIDPEIRRVLDEWK